ncbi:MAG: hypothetical protein K8I27_07710 [Planctomycetes bacterium]|nr:hypothetical protein [Planctomycetota bacterium]
MGTPTVFGGIPPMDADDQEPLDLTGDFALEDAAEAEPLPAQKVESLAAVEPFGDEPQAVDIPFEDISEDVAADAGSFDDTADGGYEETVTDDSAVGDDLDLGDLSDLDLGDDLDAAVADDVDQAPAVDIPDDDPDDVDLSLGLDDGGGVDIPSDDVDIPLDDDPGFSADAMTMVPPTKQKSAPALSLDNEPDVLGSMSLEDELMDDPANPKDKFQPNQDDTLPVWTGKARAYRDPEVEKKKETSKLNKAVAAPPGAKPIPGAKPLPGKAKLPTGAKQPITKQIKKPATGGVGPAAASGKKPAAAAGNFTVFLSPPKGADKKQAAAEIIADIQGIDMNSAVALAGKMIVPVVKGVSENEAQSVRDRFKDAGLSCRITQKR